MAGASAKTSAKDSATLDPSEYEFEDCPRCTVGSLRVVGFDPESVHEFMQGATVTPITPSGGAVHLHCFLCAHHESRALGTPDEDAA